MSTLLYALLVQKLTLDMAKVKKSIEDPEYKKGFDNMAQTATIAETLFFLGGRKRAMSSVLTLRNGKHSLLFNTYDKVLPLKDKHVKLFLRSSRS